MAIDPAVALSRVPLFADVEPRHLERLAKQFRERSFPEGAAVTREGEAGVGFFVVVEGSATASVGGATRTTIGPGDAFGEMALLDQGPRSATIIAATDLRCLALSAWEFKPFVEENPSVAWAMLQTLAARVRALDA